MNLPTNVSNLNVSKEFAPPNVRVWKIWHMQNLTDVHALNGRSWGVKDPEPFPDLPEFAGAKPFAEPAPNRPETLYTAYYPGRPFQKLPEPPVPYETFSETFSYGV